MTNTHQDVAIPSPGDEIAGKYRIQGELASGGMGTVFRAEHMVLKRPVALKVMHPELLGNAGLGRRFLREARAAARIECDYVATVTDVDLMESGLPFIVMELLQGEDLEALLEREEPLRIERVVDYMMEATAGLAAAHELGIVHRDLKPSNLFLAKRPGGERVKLLDFGIAKVLARNPGNIGPSNQTASEAVLGTPRYMSPEQISSSRDCDERADLWAMGVILYELLTLVHPFDALTPGGVMTHILTKRITPPRELREDVPAGLEVVVARCLQRDREHRIGSAYELMCALAPFASRRVAANVLPVEALPQPAAQTRTMGTVNVAAEAVVSGTRVPALDDTHPVANDAAQSSVPPTSEPTTSTTPPPSDEPAGDSVPDDDIPTTTPVSTSTRPESTAPPSAIPKKSRAWLAAASLFLTGMAAAWLLRPQDDNTASAASMAPLLTSVSSSVADEAAAPSTGAVAKDAKDVPVLSTGTSTPSSAPVVSVSAPRRADPAPRVRMAKPKPATVMPKPPSAPPPTGADPFDSPD